VGVKEDSMSALMESLQLEWVAALIVLSIGVVTILIMRRRGHKRPIADTLQDLSIYDDDFASGNFEIDPVREAEVYLAYGNREQALSLLRKAAQNQPERQDIIAKIAEIENGSTVRG
jgi:hypothetical protein